MTSSRSFLFCDDFTELFKLNLEFSFSFPGFSFQVWTWFSNMRFISYFNFIFNLFLSNYCWFSTRLSSKTKVLKIFFLVNYCFLARQPRIRVFKPGFLGFKTQVFNSQLLTQTHILFSSSNSKMAIL